MSTDPILRIKSENSAASEKIAAILGSNLRGGEFIELVSDVGGGKTTFTRGLVRGAGSSDHVSSPTFTISHIYKTPKFNIHHFDFYRLNESGLIQHELEDVLNDPKIVVVVEWSDVVAHVLPENRLRIQIKAMNESARLFELLCPSSLSYLTRNLED